ncbi:peptidase S24/S26A/S26B/S26C [Rhypophila decipiens]|uniref:Peptidase S24/S26A/S26B/S26C n=1 Tax=Rhypophila decipiens TaxID=261697 RepID=A0AAN6YJT4_9PEZI|nr:peptidase S24/S26A/S26B/S26C [Rhypophila decipiens]
MFGRLRSLSSRLSTLSRPYLGRPFRTFLAAAKFICFAHLFTKYAITASPGQGPSMLPTFEVIGEWILVSKFHRLGRNVSVGDLVVYEIPINDGLGIKRVLGLPGDYVMTGTPHHDRPATGHERMIQVPPGHCWLVGDNLPASRDSRIFGPVPLALVRGKVIAKIHSPFSYSWLENPLKKVVGKE